ncbi:MAG: CotH kinase family protein, partial [Clostridia bacterium]|nr:CotH kinase family protein [Clostridia bacterium]
LSEKNSVGSTSVDITDLEEFYEKLNDKYGEGMSLSNNYNKYEQEYQFTEGLTDPENITGGYLIERNHDFYDEVNGFKTRQGVAFNVKSPEWSSDRAMAYISEYYQEFEDAVYAVVDGKYTGYNEATGLYYYDYADKESLVRAFILNQFARNPDGFVSSTYFYKDVDGKLVCGPIWDQDITFGTGWSAIIGSHTIQYHYLEEALIKIPDFKEAVIEYYNENVLPLLEELIENGGVIDGYYDKLAGSAEMNYLLWPYIRVGDPDHDQHLWEGVDYEYVVEDLKTWITERIDVLNEQWGVIEDVEEIEYILGDVDDDGEITTSDASRILRYIVGYEDAGIIIEYGDVDEDGKITTSDASSILRWIVGYDDGYDIGETRRMPVAP